MNKTSKLTNVFENIRNSKYFEFLPDFQNEKAQKFTNLVLSIVALSFLGLFAINPTLSTIARLKKELSDNKKIDQQLNQKISNLAILQQKYSSLQNDIPFVLSSVPNNSDVPLLLSQLQSIARNTNLTITSLQSFQVEAVSSNTANKKYSSYSISFSGNGTYEDISKFMTTLLNMQRIISIDNFSISRSNQVGSLQITFRGTVYFKE